MRGLENGEYIMRNCNLFTTVLKEEVKVELAWDIFLQFLLQSVFLTLKLSYYIANGLEFLKLH